MILPEAFLTLAAFGLLTRMRIIAKESIPPGYLLVGKKELTPEDLVYQSDRTNLTPLLAELVDMGFISINAEMGRRRVVVREFLKEEDYLAATRTERDGKSVWKQEKVESTDEGWKQEALELFGPKKKPARGTRAA